MGRAAVREGCNASGVPYRSFGVVTCDEAGEIVYKGLKPLCIEPRVRPQAAALVRIHGRRHVDRSGRTYLLMDNAARARLRRRWGPSSAIEATRGVALVLGDGGEVVRTLRFAWGQH